MELRPYTPVERHPCPFYEFTNLLDTMIDFRVNQCCLKSGLYGNSCQMKNAGDKPNWSECSLNTEENRRGLANFLGEIIVFPREFHPPKERWKWDGILLRDWMDYIDNLPKE